MLAGPSVALLMLVDTGAYGPALPPAPPKAEPRSAVQDCAAAGAAANSREIVICAERPQGYRLDPDVMEAKREKREALAGRPKRPEMLKDNPCATVGPMGCRGGAGFNLAAAAIAAATIAQRLAKGEEIGSMFVTEPSSSEYQLYVEAKHRREAGEAEAAAKAKADAAARAKAAEAAAK
jgi:hypothetical protein